jgi:hypothetical protein
MRSIAKISGAFWGKMQEIARTFGAKQGFHHGDLENRPIPNDLIARWLDEPMARWSGSVPQILEEPDAPAQQFWKQV